MTVHSTTPIPCRRALLLAVTLGLTTMCSFVRTFGISSGLSQRSLQTSTSLHISLWEAGMSFNLDGDGDGDGDEDTNKPVQHEQAKHIEIIKFKQQVSKTAWCPFYFYLHEQQHYIRDPATKALHLDDELKRMESRYHQLGGDDLPQIYFPLGRGLGHFSGDMVKPSERVYELILRAYSKANLGQEGAELAEAAITRYEKNNFPRQDSTKMMAFVMNACIAAGNLERAEHWLHRIERRYEITQFIGDFPGYYIYNPFIIGLKNMANISKRKIARRSMEILDKIDMLSDSAELYELFPGRGIYMDVMKYQERGYKGSAAFFRIEKVFRQLQKNYRSTGNHPRLKPSIEALTQVFIAASKYHFPSDDRVIQRVNALFDEFDRLYKETGDPDYCPNATICNSLNSIYARMNLTDFTKRTTLLLQRMEEYNIKFKDPRDKTSAFNRILYAAESQMPNSPMSNPLETREILIVVLNIFKKFHDVNAEVTLSPNAKTYQIFLRACAKLPNGEARSKLAAKAFRLCQQNGCVTVDTVFILHKANPEHAISLLHSTNYLGFDKEIFPF
jgi:hypothetical protein